LSTVPQPTRQSTSNKRSAKGRRAKGEGVLYAVTKNGREVWKGIVYVTIDGTVKEKTCSDPNKSVAAKKLKALQEKWGAGSLGRTDETVASYLDWWVNTQWDFVDKGRKDEETVKDYENSFRYVKARLGHITLIDLTAADLYKLLVYLANEGRAQYKKGQVVSRGPLSHRTVIRVRSNMEKALATATSLGKIPVNIAKLVDIPATVKPEPKKALTEDEANLMIATAAAAAEVKSEDVLVYAFLLVGFVNGLRPGENRGLQWHRLDWEYDTDGNGRVFGAIDIDASLQRKKPHWRDGEYFPERYVLGGLKLGTQESKRIMVLPPQVVEVLRRWQVEQEKWKRAAGPDWNNELDLTFTSQFGTPLSGSNMARRIDRVLKPTGLGHWSVGELTRHSFGTRLQSDLQPAILTRGMGHKRGSTTAQRHYVVPEPEVIADHLEPMERFLTPPVAQASRPRRLKRKSTSAKK
jgi:integrase